MDGIIVWTLGTMAAAPHLTLFATEDVIRKGMMASLLMAVTGAVVRTVGRCLSPHFVVSIENLTFKLAITELAGEGLVLGVHQVAHLTGVGTQVVLLVTWLL